MKWSHSISGTCYKIYRSKAQGQNFDMSKNGALLPFRNFRLGNWSTRSRWMDWGSSGKGVFKAWHLSCANPWRQFSVKVLGKNGKSHGWKFFAWKLARFFLIETWYRIIYKLQHTVIELHSSSRAKQCRHHHHHPQNNLQSSGSPSFGSAGPPKNGALLALPC